MYKKGQFFIIAALVLVSVIIGLTTIYNSITIDKEDSTVYDLSAEINFEAAQALDQGTFGEGVQIDDSIARLTQFYKESNPEQDIIVIYGNETILKIISYVTRETGEVTLDLGGSTVVIHTDGVRQDGDPLEESLCVENFCKSSVNLILSNDATYSFNLRPGQYFYVVLTKDSGDEIKTVLPPSGLSPPTDSSDSITIDLSDEK